MKKWLMFFLLVLATMLLAACDGEVNIPNKQGSVYLKIVKQNGPITENPWLVIAAEKASYNGKEAVAEGVISIKGYNGWAVPKVEVYENRLVIPISSEDYQVSILQ